MFIPFFKSTCGILQTFSLPTGIRSKRVNPRFLCVLFCFVLPGLLSGKDFCTFGNFYKKLTVIIQGHSVASAFSFNCNVTAVKRYFS